MSDTVATQQRETATKIISAVETSQEIELKEVVKVDSRKGKLSK